MVCVVAPSVVELNPDPRLDGKRVAENASESSRIGGRPNVITNTIVFVVVESAREGRTKD